MKNKLFPLMICMTLILAVMTAVAGSAAPSAVQDGLEAKLTFPKTEFAADEEITLTLTVTNTGTEAIENIRTEIKNPGAFDILSGDLTSAPYNLEGGESMTDEVVFKQVVWESHQCGPVEEETAAADDSAGTDTEADTEPNIEMTSPPTGDSFAVCFVLMLLSLGASIVLAAKSREGKRFLSLFLCVALLGGMSLPMSAADDKVITLSETIDVGGMEVAVEATVMYGYENSPDYIEDDGTWYVYNAEGLQKWNEASSNNEMANLELMADIVLPLETAEGEKIEIVDNIPSGSNWVPIGMNEGYVYRGTIDGNGKTVSNLCLNITDASRAGFVTSLGYSGMICNLTLKNAYMYSHGATLGGFAGLVYGTIEDCHFEDGSIVGEVNGAGGIAGYVDKEEYLPEDAAAGTIRNCSNSGSISIEKTPVEGTTAGWVSGGGIVAGIVRRSCIDSCINSGSVSVVGERAFAGGIIGNTNGGYSGITGCVNYGSISGESQGRTAVGGIVGYTYHAVISECYNFGDIFGCIKNAKGYSESDVGGIVGSNCATDLTACGNMGSVTTTTEESIRVSGGVIGQELIYEGQTAESNISVCYNLGTVNGRFADGVVGNSPISNVSYCYNAGEINGKQNFTVAHGPLNSNYIHPIDVTTVTWQNVVDGMNAGLEDEGSPYRWEIKDGEEYPTVVKID